MMPTSSIYWTQFALQKSEHSRIQHVDLSLYQQQCDEEGNAIPESAADKSERMLQNKRAYDDYKAIKTIKLPANFDTAITTLYSLLDKWYCWSLDVKKTEVRRQGVTSSEQLYTILREELENQHGPHTSLDATHQHGQNLKDLRGDYIGWRAYLSEFWAGIS